ncbi:MAG: TSUP family transporter [Candidatus Thorarchaeota archaeon]
MDPIILFLAFPLGILIGLGAGIVGLTAWPIIVPLLFVIGGVPLHESLLSSLLVDLAIAITLTLFYTRRSESKVNLKLGTRFGLVAGFTATITVIIAFPLLEQYSNAFRGGSPIITLALGAIFLIQGIRMKNPVAETATGNQEGRSSSLSISQKQLLSYIFCILVGFLTGAIAIGGAMNFVIILVFLLGHRTFQAVGTAMVATTIMLSMTVLVYLILLSFSITTIFVVLLYICGGVLSSYVAVTRAQFIPEKKLRIIIGVVVIATALFASVQVFLLV